MTQLTTVLVPLDGSDLAERALPTAVRIAQQHGARLALVRAAEAHVPPGVDPSDQQVAAVGEAERYLAGIEARLSEAGLEVESVVPYGDSAAGILLEVRLRQAELVVMSTHGRGGMSRLLLGSVAMAVLEKSPVPLLLIPPMAAMELPQDQPWRVIVGLDGSAHSESVLADVISIIPAQVGAVTLVHALAPPPSRVLGTHASAPGEAGSQAEVAPASLTLAAGKLTGAGLSVVEHVGQGDPAALLCAVAREQNADIIALATHGRSGMSRLIIGSVAEGVIRGATVPVLVRHPLEQELSGSGQIPELPLFA